MKTNRNLNLFTVLMLGIFLLTAVTTTVPSYAESNDGGLVEVQTSLPFDQAVEQLKKMVAGNGMMVLSELNQGKILSMTGLKINAVSLFVGSPTVGKQLFSEDPGVGVAIPVRVNVYETADGVTRVNFVRPSAQLAAFDNESISKIGNMLDQKLTQLTGMLPN